jgi:hypothetical protein
VLAPGQWIGLVAVIGSVVRGPDPAPTGTALPPGVVVEWTGVEGCPAREAVQEQIVDRLARIEGDTQAAIVIALVAREGGGYVLDLRVRTPTATAERTLWADDCELLGRATAVIVGIAVDPGTTREHLLGAELLPPDVGGSVPPPPGVPEAAEPEPTPLSEPGAEPEPEAEPAPTRQDAARPSPGPEPTARRRSKIPLDGAIGGSAGGQLGVLPGFTPTVGGAVALVGQTWRAEAHFGHWFQTRRSFPAEPSVGARFSMWSGGVRGCGVLRPRPIEVPVCAGVDLGEMRADGFGADINREVRSLWSAAVLAPGVIWMARPFFGLALGVEGLVNLTRPGFAGEDRPLLHRPAAVGFRVRAGLEFRFGGGVSNAMQERS